MSYLNNRRERISKLLRLDKAGTEQYLCTSVKWQGYLNTCKECKISTPFIYELWCGYFTFFTCI